ncbi:hypothetical protein XF24_00608 [candidate division SR1 bacterium Aalborg_AAW-1]|nr:hypothetical protein XF24_00608 [candidate division SR1 bacterium Aalborg_AAW-1]
MPRLDRVLVISGFLCLIAGLIGAVAPMMPGSILSLVGLLLIHFSGTYQVPTTWIIVFIVLVVLANIVDYYLPIWGTKKYGGTKAGVTGSTIGMIVGLFIIPPLGMIVGPFAGAFIGEYLAAEGTGDKALKSARGSFVGFILTTGIKLVVGGRMLIYAVQLVW